MVSPSNHFVFTPLLPPTATGTLEFRCVQEPVRTVSEVEHFYQGKAREICFERQVVKCQGIYDKQDFEVGYDKLVIACGVKTNTFGTPNVAEREGKEVFFLKHLHHARSIRNRTITVFEIAALPGTTEEEKRRLLSFVIVGGGPTSCEYAAELHDFVSADLTRLYPDLAGYVSVTLIEAGDEILGPFDSKLRDYVRGIFKGRNIKVLTKTAVTAVETFKTDGYKHEGTRALLSDGTFVEFGTMVWSAGLAPVKLSERLPKDVKKEGGRILTDQYCRVLGQEGKVWAIGDAAVMEKTPLPQLAQVAQQQGKYVARAVSEKGGHQHDEFRFFSLGSMASVGGFAGIYDGSNVGDPYGWHTEVGELSGVAAWLSWRAAYWGKQVSNANKLLIPMYWFKSWAFGRDISRF